MLQKWFQMFGCKTQKCSRKIGDLRLVQNIMSVRMGASDFNQFVRLRNQLILAAKHFGRGQILSPIQITTISKDMEEQLKLARKVVDVVDLPTEIFL